MTGAHLAFRIDNSVDRAAVRGYRTVHPHGIGVYIHARIELHGDINAEILAGLDNGLTWHQRNKEVGDIRAHALGQPFILIALLKRAGVNSRYADVIHASLSPVATQPVIAIGVGLAGLLREGGP